MLGDNRHPLFFTRGWTTLPSRLTKIMVGQLRGRTPKGGFRTMKNKSVTTSASFAAGVGRALRRSAKAARKIARAHGTPVYVWRDGKVVALKP